MNIILIGAQGCGKGTQAKLLVEKYGFKHISTGGLYRKGVKEGDPTALKLKEFVDQGKLFPDDVAVQLIKNNLSEEGNILDGFPRTLNQARELDDVAKVDLVIDLHVPDKISIERLSSRRQCRKCGEIYGAKKLPKQDGVCDIDHGELFQRDDDKPVAIKERLAQYHEETEPLFEYYRPRNIVHKLDASKAIDIVFENLCRIIDEVKE